MHVLHVHDEMLIFVCTGIYVTNVCTGIYLYISVYMCKPYIYVYICICLYMFTMRSSYVFCYECVHKDIHICFCVYVYVKKTYANVYAYICVYICVLIFLLIRMGALAYMRICVQNYACCIYVYIRLCMCLLMYICVHTCIYVYICVHM